MSFLGGAECSTAGNPLSQFTKHVQDDKSLQRDRLVGQGLGGFQESFRSQRNGSDQDEVNALANQLPMYTEHSFADAAKISTKEWPATSGTAAAFCYGADAERS